MILVQNRSFTLTTGSGKQSRLRRMANSVPQGLVLTPLLYNIYTYDLPSLLGKQYAYADDIALMHTLNNWKSLEGCLKPRHDRTLRVSPYLETEA